MKMISRGQKSVGEASENNKYIWLLVQIVGLNNVWSIQCKEY
jgi:hypothetical protein